MKDESWKVIYLAAGMADANIIAGRLETEDIPAKLEYEAVGAIYGLTIDGLGEVKVLVPAVFESRAREALAEIYDENDIFWEEGSES